MYLTRLKDNIDDKLIELKNWFSQPVVSMNGLTNFSNLGDNNCFVVYYLPREKRYIKVYEKKYFNNKGIEYERCANGDDEFSLGKNVLDSGPGSWADVYLKTLDLVSIKHIIPFLTSEINNYTWLPNCIGQTENLIIYDWLSDDEYRVSHPEDFIKNGEPTELFTSVIKSVHELYTENIVDLSSLGEGVMSAYDEMNSQQAMKQRWDYQSPWCISLEYTYHNDILINRNDPERWSYVDVDNIWVHKPNYRFIIKFGETAKDNGNSLTQYIESNKIKTDLRRVFYFFEEKWHHDNLSKYIN